MRESGFGRLEWINRIADEAIVRRVAVGAFAMIILTTVLTTPVLAHGGQNTTTAGGYELSFHTDPANPVADAEMDFFAHIQYTSAERERRHADGIVNATVVISGPNSGYDRLSTTKLQNASYFVFSYRFPTAGRYTITARVNISGKQVTFRTKRRVVASTTVVETSSQTETDGSSDGSKREQRDALTSTPDGESDDHEALGRDLTIVQLLSGTSIVVAAGALWAAVLAYRGTD